MDVILFILRKLAEQDPLSLLQATCTCKSFLGSSPALWKEAFLAPYPTHENALGLEETETPNSWVPYAGQYKRLALVKSRYRRASKLHTSNLNKHAEKLPTTELENGGIYPTCSLPPNSSKYMARYLFVYKLRGKTLSGTHFATRKDPYLGYPGWVMKGWSDDGKADADRVSVKADLTSAGKQLLRATYERMLKDWSEDGTATVPETPIHRGFDTRFVGRRRSRSVVSDMVSNLEVYAHFNPDTKPGYYRECKPWDFRLCITTKRNVYTFPVCRGNVYLIPSGTLTTDFPCKK